MVRAITTLAESRIRVPMIDGRITNSGSDGMEYRTLPTPRIGPRSQRRRFAYQPTGSAMRKPSTIGTALNHMCVSARSRIRSRLPQAQVMAGPSSCENSGGLPGRVDDDGPAVPLLDVQRALPAVEPDEAAD